LAIEPMFARAAAIVEHLPLTTGAPR
jgi:hypothetical protein